MGCTLISIYRYVLKKHGGQEEKTEVIVRHIKNQGWIIVVKSSAGVVAGRTSYSTKEEAISEAQRRNPGANIEIEE